MSFFKERLGRKSTSASSSVGLSSTGKDPKTVPEFADSFMSMLDTIESAKLSGPKSLQRELENSIISMGGSLRKIKGDHFLLDICRTVARRSPQHAKVLADLWYILEWEIGLRQRVISSTPSTLTGNKVSVTVIFEYGGAAGLLERKVNLPLDRPGQEVIDTVLEGLGLERGFRSRNVLFDNTERGILTDRADDRRTLAQAGVKDGAVLVLREVTPPL